MTAESFLMSFKCEIDDTKIEHTAKDSQSFQQLISIFEFVKKQYFENTYSLFNIHTPVKIKGGEFTGKFGVIVNVFHEFLEGYENTTLCIQIGETFEWVDAENVELLDEKVGCPPKIILPITQVVPSKEQIKKGLLDDKVHRDMKSEIKEIKSTITDQPAITYPDVGSLVKNLSGSLKNHIGKVLTLDEKGERFLVRFDISASSNETKWKKISDVHILTPDEIKKYKSVIHKSDVWSPEELAAIQPAQTSKEAIGLYQAALPDSERSYQGVQAIWYSKIRPVLMKEEDKKKPVKLEPEKDTPQKLLKKTIEHEKEVVEEIESAKKPEKKLPKNQKKEMASPYKPWTEEETAIIKSAHSKDEAIALYHNKFGMLRSEDGIEDQFEKYWRATEGERRKQKLLEREKKRMDEMKLAQVSEQTSKEPSEILVLKTYDASPPSTFPADGIITGVRVKQVNGATRFFGVGVVKRINQKSGEIL
ncbi:MAG: hypothetical protein MUO73_08480, partial [Thermoplasmata archaeon]|nr:hypothetical protein [Thermoplasmata archaeon]